LRARLSQGRTGCPDGDQPVHHRPTGERPDAAEYQVLCTMPRHRQQGPRAAVVGLMRYALSTEPTPPSC
jgi:hypothetical protein